MRISTVAWRPWLPWAWGALSAVAVVIAFLMTFVVVVTIDGWWSSNLSANSSRLDLAIWLIGWAALSMAGVVSAGRLVFRRWLQIGWAPVVSAAVGIALAAAVELTLHAWAFAQFSAFDVDFIGWTVGLPFALVPTTVALFGVLIAPRGSVKPPTLVLLVMAGIVAFIVLDNVPGAVDGIDPASWPLAALVALSGLYAMGAVAIGLRRPAAG
jgi:hypothetical protein